ncbi:bone morphogenetic protein 5 [Toxorhynchites rutilus septentrionalis]|uniref:bone morphogenetic protein 5 n=1 Tax=Toxorhynchites rutilus septentrionalis TaxID=329112 RepID=UPI0024799980|nr:bone morphogenetic protein 5 [Toxorhynchites rutilus septentrionalis]
MFKLVRTMQPPDDNSYHPAKLCVSIKRTLHPPHPLPHDKHSHRYPHHYQYPIGRHLRHSSQSSSSSSSSSFSSTTSSNLTKFLILLFLSICDNRACRTLTLAEAASATVVSSTSSTTVPILATSSSSSRSSTTSIYHNTIVHHQHEEQQEQENLLDDSDSDGYVPAPPAVAVNRTKLQEIVMEGLGISEIPNMKTMNVSQQEYETKYREYLERVNRRNSLQRLQRQLDHDETDDYVGADSLLESRHLFSFPDSGHQLNHQNLRRKRSLNNNYDLVYIRFDIPTRNASTGELSGINSPSMLPAAAAAATHHHSSQNHHQRHQQTLTELPPISPENIEESSLNIMLTRRQNDERSTNINSKHQQHLTPAAGEDQQQMHSHHGRRAGRIKFKHNIHNSGSGVTGGHNGFSADNGSHKTGKTINLHIYQLVEPYERHWLTSKTIAVSEIALNDKKWFQLALDEAVRTWLDGSRKNLGLEIYCENCYSHDIFVIYDSSPFFTSYEETPVLNVVGKLIQREKRSKVQRYRPTMGDYLSPPKSTSCTTSNKRCCRHPLLVDFRDIDGFDFIIQPKIFDAGFCRGRCPLKFNPASHHAMLQSLLHEHAKYEVPKPCCAPSRLDHIDVLYADPKNTQRLKVATWSNWRVTECACS